MPHTMPEGMITTAPGLSAAEAYPQDFERYIHNEQLSITDLITELANKDDRSIVDTLMGHVNDRKLTEQAANTIIDEIAVLRARYLS